MYMMTLYMYIHVCIAYIIIHVHCIYMYMTVMSLYTCIYFHQVNRINPSDVERGKGLKDKGLAGMEASLSSVNSAGLVNFGRTPVQVYPLSVNTRWWDMHMYMYMYI